MMATLDSSQQVYPDSEAQLDQSRSAGTEQVSKSSHDKFLKPTGSDEDQQKVRVNSSSYGDVSEEEPPHHKIHSDSELLPQPKSNSEEDDQELPKADNSNSTLEPTDSYEDARATPAESHFDATKPEEAAAFPPNGTAYDRSLFGNIRQDQEKSIDSEVAASTDDKDGDNSAPQEVKSALPTNESTDNTPNVADTTVTDRGYGVHQQASEPDVEAATEHPAAKKEGFMAKMMEKLPGHHHKGPDSPSTVEVGAHDESGPLEHDSSTASPKKGIMEKIKEKLPGHHATHAHATPV